jgi:hypothetical protein
VRAEYKNELTELIEREPFNQEREKRRKGPGRVVGAADDQTSSEKHRRRATRCRFQACLDRGKRLEDRELDWDISKIQRGQG